MKVIVTTAGKRNSNLINEAKKVASEIGGEFIQRGADSVQTLVKKFQSDVVVIGKNRYTWYPLRGQVPIYFHPNAAMFRLKRLLKGEEDILVKSARLMEGMSVLDCTLGLGADSVVASLAVGKTGYVCSLEQHPLLSYIVKQGLQSYDTKNPQINEAMRRIRVHHANFKDYLKVLPDNSFDIVYFDPMFSSGEVDSDGIKGVKQIADYEPLSEEDITEAKRVAKQRILLKDHFRSERFAQLGFIQYVRKTSSFHFGVMELNE